MAISILDLCALTIGDYERLSLSHKYKRNICQQMIHIYSVLTFLLGNLNASLKVTYHIKVPLLCVILNMEPKTRVSHATTKDCNSG